MTKIKTIEDIAKPILELDIESFIRASDTNFSEYIPKEGEYYEYWSSIYGDRYMENELRYLRTYIITALPRKDERLLYAMPKKYILNVDVLGSDIGLTKYGADGTVQSMELALAVYYRDNHEHLGICKIEIEENPKGYEATVKSEILGKPDRNFLDRYLFVKNPNNGLH